MKIAICDDEKIFLSDLEEKIYKILSRLDHDVFPFTSAEELLAAKSDFDIIFLDIEMGRQNGLSVCEDLPALAAATAARGRKVFAA